MIGPMKPRHRISPRVATTLFAKVTSLRAATLGSVALLTALLGAVPLGGAAEAAPAAAAVHGAGTPARNRVPSAAFLRACTGVRSRTSSQRACERAALPVIDAARRAEGVGPMVLPSGFASMGAPLQLLVVTNLERVDRGLLPVRALSPALDQLAQLGANAGTDPPTPAGSQAGTNWAGGIGSTLLTDFVWMYDDGPGANNRACPYAGAAGCWGHRRNILGHYAAPLLMGAATAGSSAAMELVGGARLLSLTPSWPSIASSIPVALRRTPVRVSGRVGSIVGRHVTVWATGGPAVVHFRLAGTSGRWWLTRSSCDLRLGGHCNVRIGYRPGARSSATTLLVSGPGRERSLRLVGAG